MKITTIHPRDIVAVLALSGCFTLLAMGKDSFISAMTALILGYYFSKRVFEEKQTIADPVKVG